MIAETCIVASDSRGLGQVPYVVPLRGTNTTLSDQMITPSWCATLQGHDVVIVSPQYWGDYWVSKHWIAYELSRRLRTVFIEPPIWVGGVVRNPWINRTYFRRLFRPLRKIDRALYVLSPKFLPHGIERRDAVTQRTVETLQRMGIRRPIVLNFGTNFDLVKRLHGSVTVYYCVDPSFPDVGHEHDEALTCEVSDLVYAVSETYRQHLAPFCTTQPLHVIPHGYAFEHARRVAEDSAVSCPEELQALPRPILGFVGSIHDAYVDIDRVERLARRRPESSIVLIGPYQNNPLGPDLSSAALQRLRRLPNVHLLGPRHFLDVPRYVQHFDVGLVLVNVKDYSESAMTSKRTHFKWLVYLAMGKPVVAPRVHEAEAISALVYLASDDDSYIAAVDRALTEDRALQPLRVNYASQFSFDKTLELIARPIGQLLQRERGLT
jgi:glycosyltransferase involved in cell wall biosynthesis